MSTVLEELVSVLGFEIDDEGLKKFQKLQVEVHASLKKIALVGSAAAAGISVYMAAVGNATDATFKFSKTVGASFGEVQRLTHATEIWGGTAGDVMSTLSNLSRITSSAARGTGGGEIFGFLGLTPRDSQGRIKTSIGLLSEVADRIKNIESAAEQADFVQRLGISENLILLLRQGSSGIADLGAELDTLGFVMTPEQGLVAEEYVDAVVRAKFAIRSLGQEMALRLLPRVTEMVNKFIEWKKVNNDLISSKLEGWMQNMELVAKPLAFFVGAIATALLIWAVVANLAAAGIAALAGAIAILAADVSDFVAGAEGTLTGRALDTPLGGFLASIPEGIAAVFGALKSEATNIFGFSRLRAAVRSSDFGQAAARDFPPTRPGDVYSPVFNINSTDPAGVAHEVDDRMQQMMRGVNASLISPVAG